jgi:L-fucose isomerase-like protein
VGVGANCLNESRFSDTTPCLAWNMLYEDTGLLWVCEADTMSLLTKHIIYSLMKTPLMMSNLYPFLMGMAALKHEKIQKFPEIADSDNHILVVHCGYMGCMLRCWSSEWTFVPKVLAMVNENATMIDARFDLGPVTVAKLHPEMNKMLLIDGEIDGYAQYPGSDARNGALIKVKDGHKLMNTLYSHHGVLVKGFKKPEMDFAAIVLDIELEKI